MTRPLALADRERRLQVLHAALIGHAAGVRPPLTCPSREARAAQPRSRTTGSHIPGFARTEVQTSRSPGRAIPSRTERDAAFGSGVRADAVAWSGAAACRARFYKGVGVDCSPARAGRRVICSRGAARAGWEAFRNIGARPGSPTSISSGTLFATHCDVMQPAGYFRERSVAACDARATGRDVRFGIVAGREGSAARSSMTASRTKRPARSCTRRFAREISPRSSCAREKQHYVTGTRRGPARATRQQLIPARRRAIAPQATRS